MRKFFIIIATIFFCNYVVAAPQKLLPFHIVLDWFVNPQHAPIIIAKENGYFKQHGLNVTIEAPADPADPPKLVAAGKADLAIGYQPELYLQVANGLPLVRVGTLVDTPLRAVAVLQSSNIHSLSDFSDKTVGYSMAGIGTAILNTMLKNHGVNPKSVHYINVHYNLVQALLSKRVNAISGIGRNFEVPEMQQLGHPVRVFYPENNGVPNFDALIFVANRKHANNPKIYAFLQAINEAMLYMTNHPKKSWQLLIKHHPELNNRLNKTAWDITQPLFAADVITLNQNRYLSFAKWMQQNKLISTILPLQDYAIQLNPTDNANKPSQKS